MIRILGRLRSVMERIRGIASGRTTPAKPSAAESTSTRKRVRGEAGAKRRYIYPLW